MKSAELECGEIKYEHLTLFTQVYDVLWKAEAQNHENRTDSEKKTAGACREKHLCYSSSTFLVLSKVF